MKQFEWEDKIIKYMTESGWQLSRNDDKAIGFSFVEGEKHWIRDYDKKSHRFVHYDGNHTINLVNTNETSTYKEQ